MVELLEEFKGRMHISHNVEDNNLTRILIASLADIEMLGGNMVKAKEQTTELVLERARYVYNGSLEFFYDNFRESLLNLSFNCYEEVDSIE